MARRQVVAWGLYDFANSSFSTIIITFVFGRYFAEVIVGDYQRGTNLWALALNLSAAGAAVLLPIIGAIADGAGRKKDFLLLATGASVLGTALLFFTGPDTVAWALGLFVLANMAFQAAGALYDALLPEVSTRETVGRVSGFGQALGYLGGVLCLIVALGLVGGVPGANHLAVRTTNLLVAGWFLVFAVPLFLFVREGAPRRQAPAAQLVAGGFRRIGDTLREIRSYREAGKVLLAHLVYNDGLVTVFSMAAIYAGAVLAMTIREFLVLAVVLNLSAFLGALAFGFVDDRLGGKRTIAITLVVLTLATSFGAVVHSRALFWIAASIIGFVVGPNEAASRSLLSRFLPEHKRGELFGFLRFTEKISSLLPPIAYSAVLMATGSHRLAMTTAIPFFLAGLLILAWVNEPAGMALADRLTAEAGAEQGREAAPAGMSSLQE